MVEVLVSIVLVGTVGVGLFGALVASIDASANHHRISTVLAGLSTAGDVLGGPTVDFVPCSQANPAPATAYAQVLAAEGWLDDEIVIDVASVATWDGSAFTSACPVGGGALQLIRLESVDGAGQGRHHDVTKRAAGPVAP